MESVTPDDPHCPECGEPIGMTAAYCMHCSADLTEDRKRVDGDDGAWNDTSRQSSTPQAPVSPETTAIRGESSLDSGGLLQKSLIIVVSILGGVVIGGIGLLVVTVLLSVGLGFAVGILAWLGATTYLGKRRTVQETVSKGAYGIAIAIMSFSLIVFSPTWDSSSLGDQILEFVILLVFCAIAAAIVVGVGLLAARFVPESDPDR